jgi:DNA-binding MarR family transcriptional regulator
MDPQDIRSLQILEEIDDDYNPSQRDLARKLDISLGLVNSFIRRLASKGYVKITTIPRNRVRYMLTPRGFVEKSRLTHEFIQYSFRFYKKALRSLQDILDEFQKRGAKKVVFYGASDLAEIAFISLKGTDIQLVGIGDDSKRGEKFLGHTIMSMGDLDTLEFDMIIITSIDSKREIYNRLQKNKIPGQKIMIIE